MTRTVLTAAVTAALILAAVHFCSQPSGRPAEGVRTDTVMVYDTVYVDTLYIERPQPVTVRKVIVDTVYLPAVDTAGHAADSAQVLLPIETKVYEDSTYRAVVSGYRVTLDSLQIFARHHESVIRTEVVRTKPAGRFSITVGPQLGVGYTPKGVQPYIGVGVTVGIRIGK